MSFLRVTLCIAGVDWMIWNFLFLARARDFSILKNVQTGPGAQLASCSVGTGVLSWSIKWLVLKVDCLSSYCAKVTNKWNYISALMV
jgi:hypothetical protein